MNIYNRRILLDPAAPPAAGAGGSTPPAGAGAPPGGTPPLNDFIKTLPADLQGEKSLHNYANPVDLAKGFVHAQKLIGAKRVEAPQPTWGESEYNGFYEAIGRPKTADEYKIPEFKFESQPDLKLDTNRLKPVLTELHKAGLTQKQIDATMTAYFQTVDGDLKMQKQNTATIKATAEATLKAEWGDKFDVNVNIAKSVVQKFGDPDLVSYINEQGGNDPRLIKALTRIGVAMMEDISRGGNAGQHLQVTDQTRATQEITRLKGDKDFMAAMTKKDHPNHKAVVAQWLNLHKVAAPGTVEPQ